MPTLFDQIDDPCQARHGGNPESVAAHANAAIAKGEWHRSIIAALTDAGREGATLDELCVLFGRVPNAISGRLTELAAAGRIVRSGSKRKTRSGSLAAVWVIGGVSCES